jgi:hypothetical protein
MQEPMKAGDANVVQIFSAVSHALSRDGSSLGNRDISRTRSNHTVEVMLRKDLAESTPALKPGFFSVTLGRTTL